LQIQIYAQKVVEEVMTKKWVSAPAVVYVEENLNPDAIIPVVPTVLDQYLVMFQSLKAAAEAAALAAASSLTEFQKLYLGPKASAPALDNAGLELVSGALYFNSVDNIMRVYNGNEWRDAIDSVFTGLTELSEVGLTVGLTSNVLNPIKSTNAKYVMSSGLLGDGTTSYNVSDFIAWGEETSIVMGLNGVKLAGAFTSAQYDSDKVFIAGSWTATEAYPNPISKYTGASYIRITYKTQNQFNFGTEILAYEEFGYRVRSNSFGQPVYFRADKEDTEDTELPAITIQAPKKIYTVFNDLKGTDLTNVRFNSIPLWFDSFVSGITKELDIDFAESGNERVLLASHVLAADSLIESKTLHFGNSRIYGDGTVAFKQYNTKESVGGSAFPKILCIGDSTTSAFLSNIGNPNTSRNPTNFASVIKEQFEKAKIDAGDSGHDALTMGTNLTHWSMTYGTIADRTVRSCNEGHGGWSTTTFLYWSREWERWNSADRQGLWDLLGLGDGSGSDYTGSSSQLLSVYTTPEGKNAPIDTSPFLLYAQTYINAGATNYSEAVAALLSLEANPVNMFYDYAKAQTDDTAFSLATYLARNKTLSNDGTTRLVVGDTAGSSVTDSAAYDICLPSHIIIQLSHNDGSVSWFAENIRKMTDSIKADYAENEWGTVNIGISVIRHTGTFYPQRYPEFNYSDIWLYSGYDTTGYQNYGRVIDEFWVDDANEDSERIYILPSLNVQPPVWATPFRNVPSPEYDYTGQLKHSFKVLYGDGARYHPNGFCHRVFGCEMYAWIRYTLSL
jgi:hypothetical protein